MTDTKTATPKIHAPILCVENLYKAFGDTEVLRDLSFTVASGEFLTILGASGCGKTTLLRILCGLETADSGHIRLDGKDITDAAPEKRPVNTVFQSYALFPHMTVFDNIAYPLRLRKIPKAERTVRVREMLELVQMSGYEKRYPAELSGGQKQRIAIARALVGTPKVLLLDEPLGALDFHLRRRMQTELKRIQKSLGITFVYITHDQEEALNMSDRIAIMQGGHFVQLDTPSVIYNSPANTDTARFVGESNLLPASLLSVCEEKNTAVVALSGQRLSVRVGSYPITRLKQLPKDTPVTLSIRGETLQIADAIPVPSPENGICLCGTVTETALTGGIQRTTFTEDSTGISLTTARYGMASTLSAGQQISCILNHDAAVLCLNAKQNIPSPDIQEGMPK